MLLSSRKEVSADAPAAYRVNVRKLVLLAGLAALAALAYLLVEVSLEHTRLFQYAMKLRLPKLAAMVVTAFAIGGASIVFQSIIQNTIVTPCLLGMNALYTLIHTAVVFFAGSGSLLARNANLSFAADLLIMGVVATLIYSVLFQKTNHNILYVLLIGTVLSSFFSSIQTTLTRVMDPNEYDSLLTTLVASFSNINGSNSWPSRCSCWPCWSWSCAGSWPCWMCSPWERTRPSTWGWTMTSASGGCCWA